VHIVEHGTAYTYVAAAYVRSSGTFPVSCQRAWLDIARLFYPYMRICGIIPTHHSAPIDKSTSRLLFLLVYIVKSFVSLLARLILLFWRAV
jgi:hypothetical protein